MAPQRWVLQSAGSPGRAKLVGDSAVPVAAADYYAETLEAVVPAGVVTALVMKTTRASHGSSSDRVDSCGALAAAARRGVLPCANRGLAALGFQWRGR